MYIKKKKATIIGEAYLITNSNLFITNPIEHSTEIAILISNGRIPIDSRIILVQSKKLIIVWRKDESLDGECVKI